MAGNRNDGGSDLACSESGSGFAYFVAGLGVGVLVALLFAPQSGDETRDYIGARAISGKQYVTARSRDMREQADQMVEKAKDLVAQQKEQLSAALEAGKQAYQDEKSKTR